MTFYAHDYEKGVYIFNFTPPHQGPTAEPINNALFNYLFRPAAIVAFIAIPLKIFFLGIIFTRIALRKWQKKTIPLAMQLPGWLGLALFCMSWVQDALVLFHWSYGEWTVGAACLGPQTLYRLLYFWMAWMVTLTSIQYCLGILRPKSLLSNRFVTAHNLSRPAIFSIAPAVVLTIIYITNYGSRLSCGYIQRDHGRHWVIVVFFGICMLGSATAYVYTLRYLARADHQLHHSTGESSEGSATSKMQIRKAATKLFSYSILSIFLTVPLIVFPVLDASWADDDTRQLNTNLSNYVIFASMPVVLGIVWIMNEGLVDQDMLEAKDLERRRRTNRADGGPQARSTSQNSRLVAANSVVIASRQPTVSRSRPVMMSNSDRPTSRLAIGSPAMTAAQDTEPLRTDQLPKQLQPRQSNAPAHVGWGSSPIPPPILNPPSTPSNVPPMHMKTVSGSFYSNTPPNTGSESREERLDESELSNPGRKTSLPRSSLSRSSLPLQNSSRNTRAYSADSEADRDSYVSGFQDAVDFQDDRTLSLENLHRGLEL